MSQEWYLMKPKHYGYADGFESEDFTIYGEEAFDEVLDSAFCYDVQYYTNGDFQNGVTFRSSVATVSRKDNTEIKFLTKIGVLRTGYYLRFQNNWWVVRSPIISNHIYDDCVARLCEHSIRFQTDGTIWDYPYYSAALIPAIDENKYIIESGTTRRIQLCLDDNTKHITTGLRFFGESFGGVPTVYKTIDTSVDDGLLQLTVEKDGYNPETDNIDVGVCDYVHLEDVEGNVEIVGATSAKHGLSKVYEANVPVYWQLTDIDGNPTTYASITDFTDTDATVSFATAGKFVMLTAIRQSDNTQIATLTIRITQL